MMIKSSSRLAAAFFVAMGLGLGTAQAADVDKGAKTFKRKCTACHTSEQGGRNKVGPNLFGVVGRQVATHEGYRYSQDVQKLDFQWDDNKLDGWLADPKKFLREELGDKKARTKMVLRLKRAEDRENVIAYLKTLK